MAGVFYWRGLSIKDPRRAPIMAKAVWCFLIVRVYLFVAIYHLNLDLVASSKVRSVKVWEVPQFLITVCTAVPYPQDLYKNIENIL